MFNVHPKSAHFWDPKMFTTVSERGYKLGWYYYNNNYISNSNLICIHVILLLLTLWDSKSVHFYFMYLKHGSIIGLTMTL